MRFLSGQRIFHVACWFHVTVPDQPHIARRGGGCAHSVDPVAGAVRQSVRPGPADLQGVLVRRRTRPPSACRLHEGACRLGRKSSGYRPSPAEGLGGGAPGAPARDRCPRARRSSSASHADTGPRDHCRRGRGAPGPVEHADRTRAPARDDDLRGLPGPLPRWFGARLAGGGGIRRRRAAGRGARPLDRMGTMPGAEAIFSASCA